MFDSVASVLWHFLLTLGAVSGVSPLGYPHDPNLVTTLTRGLVRVWTEIRPRLLENTAFQPILFPELSVVVGRARCQDQFGLWMNSLWYHCPSWIVEQSSPTQYALPVALYLKLRPPRCLCLLIHTVSCIRLSVEPNQASQTRI